jgi:hypothetical protein
MTESSAIFPFFCELVSFPCSYFCPIGDIIVEVQRIFLYNGS